MRTVVVVPMFPRALRNFGHPKGGNFSPSSYTILCTVFPCRARIYESDNDINNNRFRTLLPRAQTVNGTLGHVYPPSLAAQKLLAFKSPPPWSLLWRGTPSRQIHRTPSPWTLLDICIEIQRIDFAFFRQTYYKTAAAWSSNEHGNRRKTHAGCGVPT